MPSLFHNSLIVVVLSATKYSVPFTFVNSFGSLLPKAENGGPVPGKISFTITVPEGVPSLFHNSLPVVVL